MKRAALAREIKNAVECAIGRPVKWGFDDCSPWVATIINNALGYDPITPWRGAYSTREGAEAILRECGIVSGLRKTAKKNGWKLIDPAFANVGDVGAALTECGPVTSIFNGHRFISRIECGIAIHPVRNIRFAWSVV